MRAQNLAVTGEFLEHAGQYGFQRREHVFLSDIGHFQIELIELAGRAVGPCILVAEAGGDLEILVEAGHHQQLLELLRRLRQGIEMTGVIARRHQVIAGPFR